MPEADYRKLAEMADAFEWFIPPDEVMGEIYPFNATSEEKLISRFVRRYSRVLYLSPMLERLGESF
jgi:hypothetical protein